MEEEEKEAIALQKRLAEKLDLDDFQMFQDGEEEDDKEEAKGESDVVKDLSKLSKEERLDLLIKKSPELLGLVEEFSLLLHYTRSV